jgi:hypothetical protein
MLHSGFIVALCTQAKAIKPRHNKPTEGIIMENITRSKILGRSVIIRKRKILSKPFSYNQGECYHNLTGGLWSLYIEHKKGRPVNVSIDDR